MMAWLGSAKDKKAWLQGPKTETFVFISDKKTKLHREIQ
jgi:hypothetical protein